MTSSNTPSVPQAVELARAWIAEPLPRARITPAGIDQVARALVAIADLAEECVAAGEYDAYEEAFKWVLGEPVDE